jgi:hypothetical protein
MATITTGTLNLTRRIVDKIVTTMPPEFDDQAGPIFSDMPNNGQLTVEIRGLTGFGAGDKVPENDNLSFDTRKQVYTQTVELPKWVKAWKHSVEAANFDPYSENAKSAGLARDALMETEQIQAAGILNDGFSGTAGPDSLSLFHTANGAGSGNPTYSSRPAADVALSADTVAQLLSEMRAVMDPRNMARRFRGNVKLWAPNELEFDVLTIAESVLKPNTTDNAKNVVSKRIVPHIMDYLTDANNWGLIAENKSMHGLTKLVGPGFETWVEKAIGVLGIEAAVFHFYKHFWTHSYGIRGTAP